jgi:hypothetical protein
VGFTGIPNDMLSGFLNNAFLAFQLWESFSRRNTVGPYHPGVEVFHATASAPYNLETISAFINAFWDSRGWKIDQKTRDLMLQIGDGKAIESPLAKHQRNLTGLLEAINVVTLAPQSGI